MSPTHNHPKNLRRWKEETNLSGVVVFRKSNRRWGSGFAAFLVSLIAHTALLLILALIVLQGLHGSQSKFQLNAAILPEKEASESGQLASVQILPPQLEAQDTQALQLEAGVGNNPKTLQELAELQGPVQRFQPEQEGVPDTAFRLAKTVAELSLASSVNEEEATDTEPGKPGEATFFGARAYGNRFVFVIDASTSMDGYRWNRAVGELLRSIGRMADGTEFFIIAFHYEPIPIDLSRTTTRTFLVKGKSSVVICRKWLRSLTLAPQTMPATSLQLAMEFNPDAIFLLSDGELRDNSLALLRAQNQKEGKPRIPINTIHLFSNDGKETLETLARENGGSFTAVGAKE